MTGLTIRTEEPRDATIIRALHRLAFEEDAPGLIVDKLRASGHSVISIVAEQAGQITGHVMFSRIEAPMRALALAPVGVIPLFQGRGIGSALIREGLDRARKEGWQAVFVLGNASYYGRFGFSAAAAQGYTSPYSGPHFMAQLWDESVPASGVLVYPSAFD